MFSIYLLIGALAGVMSGLFGIGGGVIIIPALATVFSHHTDIPTDYVMQMVVGTSMGTVIVTGASSMYAHHRHQAVIWSHVWTMMPGLAIGAILGALIANFLPSKDLRILFSLFLVITSVRVFIGQSTDTTEQTLSQNTIRIVSLLIGMLSSILGVGGGTLLVPFLLRCKLDIHQAMGTSLACGMTIGIIASASFMITGFLAGVHLPWSTGYIYWPAFIGIAAASILFAPVGASLAHKLPRLFLQKIFALFLLIMAVDMMFFSRG